MASVIFKCEDAAQQNDPERPRPQRHIDAKSNGFELAALPLDDASPPAKPGACVSLERAYCRQASQEARNTLSFASPALPSVSGVLSVACCSFWGLNTIPLRSELTAKALLRSPAQPQGAVSQKQIVRPPAKPGACVSPKRASYRQASQKALKKIHRLHHLSCGP